MSKYPAGLLAVVENAPGVTYHVKAEDLETVLQYLDEHAEDSGHSAREFVNYAQRQVGDYGTVYFVVGARNRVCLEHSGLSKTTIELLAYLSEPDLSNPEDTDDLLGITFHPLKLE